MFYFYRASTINGGGKMKVLTSISQQTRICTKSL